MIQSTNVVVDTDKRINGGISETVHWREVETGMMHQKEVKVKSVLPKGFSGQIYFKIDDSCNVSVVGLRYKEKD